MIGPELVSTFSLLQRAFPHPLADAEYYALLTLLFPAMSNRGLATVVSEFTGRDYGVVLNDVLKSASGVPPDSRALEVVRTMLDRAGFQAWLTEE